MPVSVPLGGGSYSPCVFARTTKLYKHYPDFIQKNRYIPRVYSGLCEVEGAFCLRAWTGWTRTVRLSQQYTSSLKRQQIREFGYGDRRMSDYDEDHLVPLDLGGAPYDPRNLWPEPRATADGWKDELEAVLSRRGCVPAGCRWRRRSMPLAADWIAAYIRFVVGN
jgi:hypothetical protein